MRNGIRRGPYRFRNISERGEKATSGQWNHGEKLAEAGSVQVGENRNIDRQFCGAEDGSSHSEVEGRVLCT
jgi:hypothetical protein